jgi:hypothetical protein
VALFLRDKGYRACALTGGYWAWREAGYPIDSRSGEMTRRPDEICAECDHPWSQHDHDHAAAG